MPSLCMNGVVILTRDAEIFRGKNSAWVHFGIAAFRKGVKEGRQEVDFFDAEYYVRNADSGIEKLLTKGRKIYLDRAELRNDRFTGNDGKEKSKIKILIYSFDFVDKKPDSSSTTDPKPKGFESEDKTVKKSNSPSTSTGDAASAKATAASPVKESTVNPNDMIPVEAYPEVGEEPPF